MPSCGRPQQPFSPHGGLQLLTGNLGRAVIKVSSVPDDRHVIEAPALVFDTQEALLQAFKDGELERDFVAVVRFQGPRSNGMPELHKLTPPLAVLQGKGFRVALVTDGRMSGASGKVPAAIHVSPEVAGGRAARQGAQRRSDPPRCAGRCARGRGRCRPMGGARTGRAARRSAVEINAHGLGRELFGGMRRNVLSAEEGAVTWLVMR